MNKKTFLMIVTFSFTLIIANVAMAQFRIKDDSFHLSGSVENDSRMSGFFSKNRSKAKNGDWTVFIGENGKVYRVSFIDKNIRDLFIDGQKIEDSQIWKHTAEYKPFLMKYWRGQEIENEQAELESRMKPFERKMEAIEKEIEKIDTALEKLEDYERNSSSFTNNRMNLKAQIKKLEAKQNEIDDQIEEFSNQQDKLSDEQESLKLHGEIDKVLLQITEDLKSLGVIKTTNNLSFKLSNIELLINGKKASPEMFELLKVRYVFETVAESGFLYRWKGKI